jgi:F-type H+-transporting ATPase subunit gamma
MASLKDLKNRIASVKSTRKITKAMQMVAAAKLRRAQEAAEQSRAYTDRFNAVLGQLAASAQGSENAPPLLKGTGSDQKQMFVVLTSERGLAGGFNANIVKIARYRIEQALGEGKDVQILTVGKKGREMLRRDMGRHFVDHVDMTEVKRVGYEDAARIAKMILERFEAGEFDVCRLYYSEFETVISQKPTEARLIPAEFEEQEGEGGRPLYDYEPSEEGILRELLPRGIATKIFAALLENAAGEQGARMSAMDNATRNAGDMIDDLTIEYNRSRQAAITTELIEIIAGAEAL